MLGMLLETVGKIVQRKQRQGKGVQGQQRCGVLQQGKVPLGGPGEKGHSHGTRSSARAHADARLRKEVWGAHGS